MYVLLYTLSLTQAYAQVPDLSTYQKISRILLGSILFPCHGSFRGWNFKELLRNKFRLP